MAADRKMGPATLFSCRMGSCQLQRRRRCSGSWSRWGLSSRSSKAGADDERAAQLADDDDPETVYRSLVAIGNVVRPIDLSSRSTSVDVLWDPQLLSNATGSLAVGTVKSASSKVQAAAGRLREDRIKAVAAELEAKASSG